MKKILFLFSFLCLFSGHLFAQFPAVKILQDIYPLNLFNANYTNELFRNKMVQVSTGSDTTLWFVDIDGNRAFMAQGAPTDSGGIVVTMYPVKGDGGPVTPVTFEDGVHPGDIFAWDSVAMNWVLYPFPINIYTGSGVLTANRTVGGGAHSLTINNVAGLVLASTSTLSMGASSGRTDIYSLFSDIRLTAADSLIVAAAGLSITDTDGNGFVYGGDYCDPTVARQVPDNACVKGLISDSIATVRTFYKYDDSLTSNRVVSGATHDLTFGGLGGFQVTTSGNTNLFPTGNLAETAGGNITMGITGGASNFTITDGSTVKRGLEYFADYCADIKANNLSIPSVQCVNSLIHDSLLTILQLPNGAINQTLRYSATNVLSATSSIYVTAAPKIGLLTTTTPTRYAINESGSMRFGGTSPLHYDFGNANGRLRSNATLAVRDTSVAGAIRKLTVSLENKSSADHADCEIWLTTPGTLAAAQIGFSAMGSENQFKMGVGQAQDNFLFCMGGDTIIDNSEIAFAVSPNRNIGVRTPPTDNAQMNFAAQDDEGLVAPPPLGFLPGDVPDVLLDGTLMYINDVVDRLMFVRGGPGNLYDVTLSSQTDHDGVAIDFPSAAAGVSVVQTISLVATAGRPCVIGAPPIAQCSGCVYSCQVKAANTVEVQFSNLTAGLIDLSIQDFTVAVFD